MLCCNIATGWGNHSAWVIHSREKRRVDTHELHMNNRIQAPYIIYMEKKISSVEEYVTNCPDDKSGVVHVRWRYKLAQTCITMVCIKFFLFQKSYARAAGMSRFRDSSRSIFHRSVQRSRWQEAQRQNYVSDGHTKSSAATSSPWDFGTWQKSKKSWLWEESVVRQIDKLSKRTRRRI